MWAIEDCRDLSHHLENALISAGGVLRFWGDFPEFAQRFSATLESDSFEGLWQLARPRVTGGMT